MKLRHHFIALAALACIFSCGENAETEKPKKAEAAKLVSTTPADGATDISIAPLSVVFTYDQNIKCPIDKQALIQISPNTASISSIGAYGTDLTIKIDGLAGETQYTVTVPAGAVSGYKSDQEETAAASVRFKTKAAPVPVPEVDPDVLPQRGSNIAWQMAEKMGFGWNMGNQMDAFNGEMANETCWGNPACTQATFTKLKSYGVKTVRIPITWVGHIGAAPEYKIDDAWMKRVAEIVGYAEAAGLICIINTHHDENNNSSAAFWLDIKGAVNTPGKNSEIKNEIKAVWTQIANQFKSKGDWLIFESFNEIQDGGWGWSEAFKKNPQIQYDILNEWNQVFVDAVRATGGNNATRFLGVPGYAANPGLTLKGFVLPKDSAKDRLMVGVHSYDPSSFCGAGTTVRFEEWGHSGAAGKKPAEDERVLRKMMAELYEAYVSKGIPCYFGECGCVNKTSERSKAFQKYYLEYFSKAARSYGMPCIIWDNGVAQTSNGEAFGYVNHGTGAYIGNGSAIIPAMAKGQNDSSPSYTLESVYNSAP